MKTTSALYKAIRAVEKLGRAMEEDMQADEFMSMSVPDFKRLKIQHERVADIYDRLAQVADAFGRDRRGNENP